MPWLCSCGNGNLCEPLPPDECPLCGFDFTPFKEDNDMTVERRVQLVIEFEDPAGEIDREELAYWAQGAEFLGHKSIDATVLEGDDCVEM